MASNPILTAYLQSVQQQHQQEQLENEREQAQEMVKFHQDTLKQTAAQHANDLKLRTAIAKQEMQNHFNELYGNAASTPINTQTPQGSLGGQVSGTTGDAQNPIDFQQPQQIIGNQPYEATPQQGWTPELKQLMGPIMIDPQYQQKQLAAQKPVLDAQAAQQQKLQDIKTQGQIKVQHAAAGDAYQKTLDSIAAKNDGTRDVQNLKNDASDERSRLMYLATMARIANTNRGNDPDDAEFSGSQVATAKVPYAQIPAKSKPGVDTWLQTHGYQVPRDVKGIGDAMSAAHTLFDSGGLMDQYKDAIDQYSANGTLSSIGNAIQAGTGYGPVAGVLDNLRAQAGPVRKFFDQNNRSSESEALRSTKGIFDPKLSKEENIKNYINHISSMTDAIVGKLSGLPPEQQNRILTEEGLAGLGYQFDFKDKKGNITSSQIVPVFKRDSNSGTLIKFDPKKEKYFPATTSTTN